MPPIQATATGRPSSGPTRKDRRSSGETTRKSPKAADAPAAAPADVAPEPVAPTTAPTQVTLQGLPTARSVEQAAELAKTGQPFAIVLAGIGLTDAQIDAVPFAGCIAADLSRNAITKLPKKLLANSQSIIYLDLSGQANGLPACPEFLSFGSLMHLDVSNNGLPLLHSSLAGSTRMVTANVSGNALSDVPAWIARWPSLVELQVQGNKLSVLPSSLGQLRFLAKLDASNNRIGSLPVELARCPDLAELKLEGNPLTTVPLALMRHPLGPLREFVYRNLPADLADAVRGGHRELLAQAKAAEERAAELEGEVRRLEAALAEREASAGRLVAEIQEARRAEQEARRALEAAQHRATDLAADNAALIERHAALANTAHLADTKVAAAAKERQAAETGVERVRAELAKSESVRRRLEERLADRAEGASRIAVERSALLREVEELQVALAAHGIAKGAGGAAPSREALHARLTLAQELRAVERAVQALVALATLGEGEEPAAPSLLSPTAASAARSLPSPARPASAGKRAVTAAASPARPASATGARPSPAASPASARKPAATKGATPAKAEGKEGGEEEEAAVVACPPEDAARRRLARLEVKLRQLQERMLRQMERLLSPAERASLGIAVKEAPPKERTPGLFSTFEPMEPPSPSQLLAATQATTPTQRRVPFAPDPFL